MPTERLFPTEMVEQVLIEITLTYYTTLPAGTSGNVVINELNGVQLGASGAASLQYPDAATAAWTNTT